MSAKKQLLFSIFSLVIFLSSCGKKVNSHKYSAFSALEAQHLLIEKKCASNKENLEPITLEIVNYYKNLLDRFPLAFISLPEAHYNFRSPLIVSLVEQEKRFLKLKEKEVDETLPVKDLPAVIAEIYTLYHNSMRFEGQKCSFDHMAKNGKSAVKPFLEMRELCLEKENSEVCSSLQFSQLNINERKKVQESVVKICEAFDSRGANCHEEFEFHRKNRTLPNIITKYQKRFQTERYNKLFSIRPDHQKFACSKTDVIEMTVKVYEGNWDKEVLEKITQFTSSAWSKNGFVLTVDLVDQKGSDVVEIIPTASGVSYVPDTNTFKVYLSSNLDIETKKKVLAHEFGHVLGFPDCYVEFFDSKEKSLVYYELHSGETNIMCSLQAGSNVPETYIQELVEKSCVFQ